MAINQKHAFWEAFVIAVFIFGLGVLIGVFIENSRAGEITGLYLQSEINLLDIQIQTQTLELENLNCEQAIHNNIKFGDKIYNEAKLLTRYEDASRITEELKQQHRRYDLLRNLFWINSIKIKQKCGPEFSTVVYLYEYEPDLVTERNKQVVFSRYLGEIKQKFEDKIVLIPIAINMNLDSVEIMISKYGINQTSIIVDEKLIITELDELFEIDQFLENLQYTSHPNNP